MGSSVPAWPTFLTPSPHRTFLTTPNELIPPGLSTSTAPASPPGGGPVSAL